MPELPEVETIRLDLESYLRGATLTNLQLLSPDIFLGWPTDLALSSLEGKTLLSIDRLGKYLIFHFSGGLLLLVHLRMTGKLLYLPALPETERTRYLKDKHTHVLFTFTKPSAGEEEALLLYHDVRRFGRLTLVLEEDLATLPGGFNELGPDALADTFNWTVLQGFANKHQKMPVKSLLLDQRAVAGIGNIYADECLFQAKIRPDRPASSLTELEWQTLTQEVVTILRQSIALGGTSFRDYRNASNEQGQYAAKLQVYSRAGAACFTCGQTLSSLMIGGRRSIYCEHCQK